MPHIHTQPGQHDQTISMYIVRTDGPEPRVLFHLHKAYQVYMQFGGHVELNENPWQAALRELKEEAGYEAGQLKVLQPKTALRNLTGVLNHPIPISFNTHKVQGQSGHFHIDSAFAFVASAPPRHKLAGDESQSLKLLTRKELAELPADKTYENGRETAIFILDNCLKDWDQLPAEDFALTF